MSLAYLSLLYVAEVKDYRGILLNQKDGVAVSRSLGSI